jgi:hypothetical protein
LADASGLPAFAVRLLGEQLPHPRRVGLPRGVLAGRR